MDVLPLRPADPGRLDEYYLIGILAATSARTVYVARGVDGPLVVIAILNAPDEQERFRWAIEAARSVPPFVTARVLDIGEAENGCYVVREYLEAESLERHVARTGPLDRVSLEALAMGLATVVTAIHSADLVSGDITPGNILLCADGPRVLDFSAATVADGGIGRADDVRSWATTIMFAAADAPAVRRPLRDAIKAALAPDPVQRPTSSELLSLLAQ